MGCVHRARAGLPEYDRVGPVSGAASTSWGSVGGVPIKVRASSSAGTTILGPPKRLPRLGELKDDSRETDECMCAAVPAVSGPSLLRSETFRW